ncbi:MAG: RNA methyltransferase [Propionibacteriaceae bacterium]|jgi:tRNA G18 (ribose-2'-O)-methylase SpoU|nr:RNA methyltransferase [Propionibacteriaceae bacterium]
MVDATGGQVVELTSRQDPRLAHYRDLREASLRRGSTDGQACFIAEGPLVVRRAVAAGYEPISFLLTPVWVERLADVWSATAAPVYRGDPELIESLTGFHVHRGALAALRRREPASLDDLLALDRLVVVQDLVDHANLGAIMRCAAGLGWDGLVLSAGAVDPLYRRAVKTSMGAVFILPWARAASGLDLPARLRRAGFRLTALSPRPDAIDLAQWAAQSSGERLALLLGSEGPGLSPDWLAAADQVVRIPMWRGLDSLNVATAAAIACYALGPSGAPSGRKGRLGEIGQSGG